MEGGSLVGLVLSFDCNNDNMEGGARLPWLPLDAADVSPIVDLTKT